MKKRRASFERPAPARGQLIQWHCTRPGARRVEPVARGILGGGCVALGGMALAVMQTNPSPSRNRRRRNTAFDRARPVTRQRGK